MLKKQKKKYVSSFLFFVDFLFLGLLFFIHIIPLEVIFAERWLYITEIGLLGILGILFSTVSLPKTKWMRVGFVLGGMLLLCFVIETMILNIMWLDWQHHFHNF